MPDEYTIAGSWSKDVSRIFGEELVRKIEPLLNAHLQTMPQDTLPEKRSLAIWVNRELRELGLCIRCPKTGAPAILVADFSSAAEENVSRFRIDSRQSEGHRKRTTTSYSVPKLELMAEPPRKESLAKSTREGHGPTR